MGDIKGDLGEGHFICTLNPVNITCVCSTHFFYKKSVSLTLSAKGSVIFDAFKKNAPIWVKFTENWVKFTLRSFDDFVYSIRNMKRDLRFLDHSLTVLEIMHGIPKERQNIFRGFEFCALNQSVKWLLQILFLLPPSFFHLNSPSHSFTPTIAIVKLLFIVSKENI